MTVVRGSTRRRCYGVGMTGAEFSLAPAERGYLRALACRQAEVAMLPVMEARRRQWTDLNDGKPGTRPPVIVETWTFDRDFLPPSSLRCATAFGREVETRLIRNLRTHELLDDDKVVPGTFDMTWSVEMDEFGVKIPMELAQDAQGEETGYRWEHPIADLERDFAKLTPAVCRVDRSATAARRAALDDLLGDLLPVRLSTGIFAPTMLTHRAIMLMGMEGFFGAMIETPAAVHRLMAYLRDNALRVMRWAEVEGLLRANSGNQESFGSSFNFTERLPAESDRPVHLSQMWGATNSQESIGISPAMYSEFCFPYYRDVAEPLGRLYYGCCEPAHPYWDDIRRLAHLSKVSCPKWCDQRFLADAIRGTGIVLSRKPDPNLIGVHPALDEDAWTAHIRETMEAAKGVPVEFILRDVYTVHGNLDKPRRAIELARKEIARFG